MLRKIIGIRLKTVMPCLLSGVLLSLPFNNGKLWLLSWFAFLPLFAALKSKSRPKAFFLSYVTGVIFWLGAIYWLIHVTLAGTIILILYLAIYYGIFGFIFSAFKFQTPTARFLFLPPAWVALEYLRGHLLTGFPWALLGYSQYLNLPVIQISDITGAWGVSFLVMLVNVTVYSIADLRLPIYDAIKKHVIPLFCVAATLIYGCYKIYRPPPAAERATNIRISVIQGNIPQGLKWEPSSRDYIVNKYLDITTEAAKNMPDLIVWPEASLPVVLQEEPESSERVRQLAREVKTPLVLGAVTTRGGLYYNSAILISSKGEILGQYDKLHLVPFGEYIPLKSFLAFMETVAPIGDIEKGRDYTVFPLPVEFSVLICFEDLFPNISREFVKRGATLLVNITNDAWYKETPAPFQHFQASVFRAIENRIPLVRSANTGVSGFIDSCGRIVSLVSDKAGKNIFVTGFDTRAIMIPKSPQTFYTRYGDVFAAICILLTLSGAILKTARRT